MNFVDWWKNEFEKNSLSKEKYCVTFEDAPSKKLLEKIIDAVSGDSLIGFYCEGIFDDNTKAKYNNVELSKTIEDVWNFYMTHPDAYNSTVLTDINKSFLLAVPLGSDKNLLCGNKNIVDIVPKDNDFSIFRDM